MKTKHNLMIHASFLAYLALAVPTAQAAPVGGNIVGGQGNIAQAGATTTITQDSQRLAIDWQSFGIGLGETVQFVQPSALSVAVNRVLGRDSSAIYGKLNANGQVYLINPNGILFSQTAQVNVGGLVASTHEVDPDTFTPSTAAGLVGTVVNNGSITATAGDVTLLGRAIGNTGVIEATGVGSQAGRVFLLGDKESGSVAVDGTLKANFVETSAATVNVADSAVLDTQGGTWLIDPTDFNVGANAQTGAASNMSGAALTAALAGGNVTIDSNSGSSGTHGDVNINDLVNWNTNTLTLTAAGDVWVNNVMTAGGNAGLVVNYGNYATSGDADAANLAYGFRFNLDMNPATQSGFLGKVNFTGSPTTNSLTVNGTNFILIDSLGTESSSGGNTLQGMRGYTQLGPIGDILIAKSFALMGDIDASDTASWNSGDGFVPITNGKTGGFDGSFLGLGHTIDNLTINKAYSNGSSLLGLVVGGPKGHSNVIGNVGFRNVNINGVSGTAALASVMRSSQSNYYSLSTSDSDYNNTWIPVTSDVFGTGTVTSVAGSTAGGLLGVSGDVRNAWFNGTVSGGSGVGGLVSSVNGTLTNAWSMGTVIGTGSSIGGLAAGASSVTNSFSTATVQGGSTVGGLVGTANNISQSFYQGTVTGKRYVGGLAGGARTVTDAYASGSVTGEVDVGGVIGSTFATGPNTLTRVYFDGTLSAYTTAQAIADYGFYSSYAGTLVGSISLPFTLTGGVSHAQILAGDVTVNGTAITSAEASYFTGWDVDRTGTGNSLWRQWGNMTMPVLSFMLDRTPQAVALSGQSYTGTYNGKVQGFTIAPHIYAGAINVGTYAAQNQLYSDQFGYYTFSPVTGTGTIKINPVALHAVVPTGAVYNGLAQGIELTGFVNGEDASVLGDGLTYNGAGGAPVNAGTYVVDASGMSATNYTLSGLPADASYTIDKADLGITIDNLVKTYGQTVAPTWQLVSGTLYGSDSLDSLNLVTQGADATAHVGKGDLSSGNYSITLGSTNGTGLSNYNIDFTPGVLQIMPATVHVYSLAYLDLLGGGAPDNSHLALQTYKGSASGTADGSLFTVIGAQNGDVLTVRDLPVQYGAVDLTAPDPFATFTAQKNVNSGNNVADINPGLSGYYNIVLPTHTLTTADLVAANGAMTSDYVLDSSTPVFTLGRISQRALSVTDGPNGPILTGFAPGEGATLAGTQFQTTSLKAPTTLPLMRSDLTPNAGTDLDNYSIPEMVTLAPRGKDPVQAASSNQATRTARSNDDTKNCVVAVTPDGRASSTAQAVSDAASNTNCVGQVESVGQQVSMMLTLSGASRLPDGVLNSLKPLAAPAQSTPAAPAAPAASAIQEAINQIPLALTGFLPGSSVPADADALARQLVPLAKVLQTHPDASVTLVGNTDSTGSAALNQRLSVARAQSIADVLAKLGVGASQLVVKGVSYYQPIASNETAAGRFKNRRVSIQMPEQM